MTPAADDRAADDRALAEFLGPLGPAIAAELGTTDAGTSAPQYHRASVGRTRLRSDGSIKLSRRDWQTLAELASGRGDSDDPAWCARAAKAIDNVLTAQVQRHPVGPGTRASHFRRNVAVVEGARSASVLTAGSGALTLVHPLSDPVLRGIYDATRWAVDLVAEQAAEAMSDDPSRWSMGLLAAGAAVSAGVPAAAAATRVNQTLDRGMHAAWVRACGAEMRDRLGVADRFPAGKWVSLPGGRGPSADAEQTAEGLARRVAEMTGSDTRTVLNRLVQVPSVDRVETAVGMVLDQSAVQVSDGLRDRVVGEVYLGLSSRKTDGVVKGIRAIDEGVNAILEADRKAGGSLTLSQAFPAARLVTVPGSALANQDQAVNAALSALPEAGRSSGSDGARSGPPAGGWAGGKNNDRTPRRFS